MAIEISDLKRLAKVGVELLELGEVALAVEVADRLATRARASLDLRVEDDDVDEEEG